VRVKSGSEEVRDAGVLTGEKREILRDVSHFIPGYNGIEQTFAMGVTHNIRYVVIFSVGHTDLLPAIRHSLVWPTDFQYHSLSAAV